MDSNPTSDRDKSPEPVDEAMLEKAEPLIWALLDDNIESVDAKLLEGMMAENPSIRDLYIQCVQMHCDLQQHFAGDTAISEELPKSPVLGSLGDLRPGTDTLPLRD